MKACNDLFRFFLNAKSLACFGLFFVALVGNSVNAQTAIADSSFDRFMSSATGAGKTTVSFGSGGVPVVSQGVPTLATDGTAKPLFTRMGTTANPSGNPLAITATGRIASSKFVPLLIAGAKLAPVLGTGIALYEMFDEIGYKVSSSGGVLDVRKVDPQVCTSGTACREYQDFWTLAWGFSSVTAACQSGISTYNAGGYGQYTVFTGASGISCSYNTYYRGSNVFVGPTTRNIGNRAHAPWVDAGQPSTELALSDAIAAKSGWPTSSQLAPAIKQAQELTGQKLQPESVTITGPATSTGPTTTTTKPGGVTETKTINHGHTYSGDTITTVTNTTVNNYNPTTNITETTTTTETPTPQKTACELDPKSIGCQSLDVPTDKVPTRTETVSWAEENLGLGGGSCPAPYSFTSSIGTYSLDLSQYCGMLSSVVKPIVIAMALLAAFFIVAPVKTGA
jgi:hypothetical protein